jgi:hypothetical protein
MADIDLIPRSYREQLRVQRTLRRYALVLAAVLALGAAGAGGLRWHVARTEPQLARMRADASSSGADSVRLATLQTRHTALVQQVAALGSLRAPGAVRQLAESLDQSLRADLWLTGIRYERSELALPAQTAGPARPDELQVQVGAVAEHWRISRRVDLSGAALSYPTLTEFMRGFASQGGIADVQLIDSSSPDAAGGAIGFNVTALAGAPGAKR